MNFQVVRENALKYLGYQAPMFEGLTPGISSLLGECIEEIKQIAQPKVIVKRFKLAKDPLRLEESGDEILGQLMDAAASAYLEEYCDRYEETLGFDNRTYRACPGYGDFPLEFNKRIAILLDIPRKIGVTITPNNLLIPQKSMLGLIGIGSDKRKKSCGNCVMKEDCPFRKRGQRCYRTD